MTDENQNHANEIATLKVQVSNILTRVEKGEQQTQESLRTLALAVERISTDVNDLAKSTERGFRQVENVRADDLVANRLPWAQIWTGLVASAALIATIGSLALAPVARDISEIQRSNTVQDARLAETEKGVASVAAAVERNTAIIDDLRVWQLQTSNDVLTRSEFESRLSTKE